MIAHLYMLNIYHLFTRNGGTMLPVLNEGARSRNDWGQGYGNGKWKGRGRARGRLQA